MAFPARHPGRCPRRCPACEGSIRAGDLIPMAYVGILWTLVPPEQRPRLAWDVKPVGRHGSRVQRRRARGRR